MADTIPNINSEILSTRNDGPQVAAADEPVAVAVGGESDGGGRRGRGRPRTRSDREVLAAARRVVGARGLARLTIADVAREAGLAPSTVAERYGSKRALLLAALQDAPDGVGEAVAAARAEHPSPLAALHAALASLSGPVGTREAFANHLGMLALDVTDPDFRRIAARWFAEAHEQLRALLADAVAGGELRATADPAALARAVLVAYNGALSLWAVTATAPLADTLRADVDAVLSPWR
jgi:AcrR family transcriptional regulator